MSFSDPILEVNENTLKEFLMMSVSLNIKVRFPAIVMSYDRAKNIATVQIAIKFCNSSKEFSEYPLLEVPVHRYGGGGYHISCDLKEGDLGDVVFYDRDMTKFLETLSISETITTRSHALEDSEFIPIDRKVKETEETKGLLLTKDDNTISINLTDESVLVKNNTSSIEVKADTIALKTNTVDITAPTGTFSGSYTSGELHANNGATGTFVDTGTGATGKTLTFQDGICIGIA